MGNYFQKLAFIVILQLLSSNDKNSTSAQLVSSVVSGLGNFVALEAGLREELFVTNKYEVHQRPDEKVNITVSLTILTVNDLDIKEQALSVSGYLSINWYDGRLDWSDQSKYSNYKHIQYLFSTEDFVWRPALVIENSIREMGVINNKHIPMRITQQGNITWNPSGIYYVSCESDTTYYPIDTQDCTIKVSSWAYTATEVYIDLANTPVFLQFYVENGEWDLLSAYSSKPNDTSIEGTSFSSVTFNLRLQRRPTFHIINTLTPVAIMALLISMVFRLPIDSGEKNGFGLTVFLAYAVYLTIISESIPSTSMTVCYLSVYLVFVFGLGAMSILLTIWVLRVHHSNDVIPRWVMVLFQSRKQTCQVSDYYEKEDVEYFKNEPLTWQSVAMKMDVIFFWVYLFIIFAVTICLLCIYAVQYNDNND